MVAHLLLRPRRPASHLWFLLPVSCGLATLALGGPALAAGPERSSTDGYHSGFYARFMGVGPGWLQLITKEGQNTAGGSFGASAAFGHDFGLVRGLVFGLGFLGTETSLGPSTPSYTVVDSATASPRRVRPSSLAFAVFGALCQYYPKRGSGWNVGGIVGWAQSWLWNKELEGFAWSVSAGAQVWAGYDVRLASELALGISLTSLSAIPAKLVDTQGRTVSSVAVPVGYGLEFSLLWY